MAAVDEKRAGAAGAALPAAGPLGEFVAATLAGDPLAAAPPAAAAELAAELLDAVEEPLGDDDLHLALHLLYEQHYRSFPTVDPGWEWSPTAIAVRAVLEAAFMSALENAVGFPPVEPGEVGDALFRLEEEQEGPSLSRYLESEADLEQVREFVVHRSLYQLKEADPHSWAIPRLAGAPKAALVEVQADEYGGGRPERMHSTLFAKTMRALGLDDRENAYLDRLPGTTIATLNLISALGLSRARRGALVGHLAMFEMTSALPNRRYGNALRRLGFGPEATHFYDEHVEADAVHENIAAHDLAGGLVRREPELAADVLFGARALLFLEDRFARRLLERWRDGASSLSRPLGER